MMKPEHFQEALAIITTNNQIKVSFNTPVHDNYCNVYDILIHESNGSVITKLVNAGFSLSMTPKGLSVTKF